MRHAIFIVIIAALTGGTAGALPSDGIADCGMLLSLYASEPGGNDPVDLAREQLIANVRFPQMQPGVLSHLATVYLTRTISASEMLAPPSEESIDSLLKAMDKQHRSFQVPHRSEGHPESDGKHIVPRRMIADFATGFSVAALRNIWSWVDILDRDEHYVPPYYVLASSKVHQETLAKELDDLFRDPKRVEVANQIIAIGNALKRTLDSAAMRSIGSEYLHFMSDPANHRTNNEDRFNAGARKFIKQMGIVFDETLKGALPQLHEDKRRQIVRTFFKGSAMEQ